MLSGQDWYCVDADCVNGYGKRSVLGRIIKGELVIDSARANTDGTRIVVICPKCGRPKTWFATDRKVISEAWMIMYRMIDKVGAIVGDAV